MEESLGKRYEPEDRENCKVPFSRNDMATIIMNSQQLQLLELGLHKTGPGKKSEMDGEVSLIGPYSLFLNLFILKNGKHCFQLHTHC